jgi:hypothetical protein
MSVKDLYSDYTTVEPAYTRDSGRSFHTRRDPGQPNCLRYGTTGRADTSADGPGPSWRV